MHAYRLVIQDWRFLGHWFPRQEKDTSENGYEDA